MTARESLMVLVKWGGRHIVYPSPYRFDVFWLRRTTLRELLIHVLVMEVTPHHVLDSGDSISVTMTQHIDECTIVGSKRIVKINATIMLDEEVFVIVEDIPTRNFDFVIKSGEPHQNSTVCTEPVANAFDFHIAATSRDHFLLLGPRDIAGYGMVWL